MKSIGTKFYLLVGVFIAFFSIALLSRTFFVSKYYANALIGKQADIALQFDISIRKYIAENIRPAMYKLVGPDECIPEIMSTSFVARSVFDDVRKEFPDVILKFSSDNPRNPSNQAGPQELEIIRYFNANPEVQKWEGQLIINGKQYMARFRARRMKEECLHCHGDPADAPASLLEKYGSTAGFHRPINEVIALDTVAIPMDKINNLLWTDLRNNIVAIMSGVTVLFFTIFIVFKYLIGNRLSLIARHFLETASQNDYLSIRPLEVKGNDEITSLTQSFNSLATKIHKYNISLQHEIIQHAKVEEALKENELYLKNIMNTMQAGLIVIDADTHVIVDANSSASELFGASRKEIIGKICHRFICPKEQGQCPITDFGQIIDRSERKILNVNGVEIPVLKSVSKNKVGGKEYLIETFVDISDQKQLEAKLHEASVTDELTGLFNRRGFFAMAEKIFHNAERKSCDLFVLFLDLDNLKLINDKKGHTIGDQAIAETASVLKSTFRQADVIGRIGGDEFVILYTDKIGTDNQQLLINRLKKNLKNLNEQKNRDYAISLSHGFVKYDRANPSSLDELISQADTLMYKCKKQKKNLST